MPRQNPICPRQRRVSIQRNTSAAGQGDVTDPIIGAIWSLPAMRTKSGTSAGCRGRKRTLGVVISTGLTACHCSGLKIICRMLTTACSAQLLCCVTTPLVENPIRCNSAAERVLPVIYRPHRRSIGMTEIRRQNCVRRLSHQSPAPISGVELIAQFAIVINHPDNLSHP